MKRLLLIPAALLLFSTIFAQTGKEFWFAVPYVDKSHDKDNGDNKQTGPNYFRISTGEAGARVEFYNFPGGNAASRNELLKFTIPANSIETVSLVDGATDAVAKKISLTTLSSNGVYSTVLNKGLYIEASNPVTVYYEIGAYNNTDIFALKGFDALGTEFYPSFQNKFENEFGAGYATDSWESIDLVATEDGTDVTIELPATVSMTGTVASFSAISTTSVTLNAGQSYSLKSNVRTAIKPFDGIKITSTKPISLTAKDDGVNDDNGDGDPNNDWAADMVGDQAIPTRVAGFKYIVPDFNTGSGHKQSAFIRALHDGTQINIAGETNPVATLNKGDIFSYSSFLSTGGYKYIYGSDSLKPFMCFHIAGYRSGIEAATEFAGAMIPPVDQYTGSMQSSFNKPAEATGGFSVALLSLTNEAGTFRYKKQGDLVWTTINPVFTTINIGGRNWYLSYDLGSVATVTNTSYLVKNTKSVFHLGVLSGLDVSGSRGSFYGYFSDYSKESIQASFDTLPGGQVVLYAFGGTEGSYQWTLDKPAPVAATCVANYFDPGAGYPTCGQANPINLSTDILSIPGMYKYKIVATSPYGELMTSYIQFEVVAGKAHFVPLPVELLHVTAHHTGGQMVTVGWATASETNNHYFTVERAADNGEFEPVATVAGAGSTSERSDYSITDGVPAPGVYYYRVSQTDYNGVSSYSETAAVRVGHADKPISVFPTLLSAGQPVCIVPNTSEDTDVMVKLIAIDGQCIYAGMHNFNGNAITIAAPVQSGLYKICIEYGGHIFYKTIIVNP